MIKIHDTAKVSENCDIEDSVRGSVIEIGAFSNIDSFVKIKPAGGYGNIKLGKRVHINSCCVLYSGNGILIGNNVLVAANCTFAPVNHEYKSTTLKIIDQGHAESKGGIVIEDNVWIGANCVLLDGSHIGEGSVIAAGSVVRERIKGKSLYGGNPLKLIKSI